MNRYSKNKKGFTLIELMLVVSIGLAISFVSFNSMIKKQEDGVAENTGSQLKMLGSAVNNYIVNHYDALSTLKDSQNLANDPGPRTCNTANNTCTITTETLKAEGLVQPNFTGINPFGSKYTIVFKRSGSAPYWNVSGMVTTVDPWYGAQNKVRFDLLGRAMQTAGLDSGMIYNNAGRIDGYKSIWFATGSDFYNIQKLGQLGYITGYGSNSFAVFLRRDGTLPMTGSLNMDGHDINAAKNITASATIQGQTLKSTGDTNTGANLTVEGTSRLKGNVNADNQLTVGGTSTLVGNVTANNQLTVGGTSRLVGNVTADNQIIATGKIRSESYFEGKNGGGDGFRIGGSDSNDIEFALYTPNKPLTVWRNGGASNESRFNVLGSQNISGDLNVTAGPDGATKGQISTTGNITSGATLVGQTLALRYNAVLGATCANIGEMARDSQGYALSCVANKWSTMYQAVNTNAVGINNASITAQATHKKVVVTVSSLFLPRDGGHTSYVNFSGYKNGAVFTNFQNNIVVNKGGSRGHYWGYQSGRTRIMEYSLTINPGDVISINTGTSYLLSSSDVRIELF